MRPTSPIACRSEAPFLLREKLNLRPLVTGSLEVDWSGGSVLRQRTADIPHRLAQRADMPGIGSDA